MGFWQTVKEWLDEERPDEGVNGWTCAGAWVTGFVIGFLLCYLGVLFRDN